MPKDDSVCTAGVTGGVCVGTAGNVEVLGLTVLPAAPVLFFFREVGFNWVGLTMEG